MLEVIKMFKDSIQVYIPPLPLNIRKFAYIKKEEKKRSVAGSIKMFLCESFWYVWVFCLFLFYFLLVPGVLKRCKIKTHFSETKENKWRESLGNRINHFMFTSLASTQINALFVTNPTFSLLVLQCFSFTYLALDL